MGLVGLMSRATGNLAGLAVGSSASVAVVADETPYRYSRYGSRSTF